jgi:hypothetical protein
MPAVVPEVMKRRGLREFASSCCLGMLWVLLVGGFRAQELIIGISTILMTRPFWPSLFMHGTNRFASVSRTFFRPGACLEIEPVL